MKEKRLQNFNHQSLDIENNISLMYIPRGYCYIMIIMIKTRSIKRGLRELICHIHIHQVRDPLVHNFIVFFLHIIQWKWYWSQWNTSHHVYTFFFLSYLSSRYRRPCTLIICLTYHVCMSFSKFLNHVCNVKI